MPSFRRRSAVPAAVLVGALAVGCGGPAPVSAPTARSAPAVAVELTPVSAAGLAAAVAEQKGKTVLLDVWFFG